MTERKIMITAKAIDAAMFFADLLGMPTQANTELGTWEWWHEEGEEDEDGRPLGQWVRLFLDGRGELHATIFRNGPDRSDQYALAGYCAIHGITYTAAVTPNNAVAEGEADPKVARLRDHRRGPKSS